MVLSAGQFDEVVKLQRPTRARNTFGEDEITAWADVADIFARVIRPNARDLSKETATAARVTSERVITFIMRWPLDVQAGDRILWESEPYGVEGFTPDKRKGEITVTGVFRSGTDGR